MAMNLMLPLTTLINKRKFKKRPHIRSFTRQRDENRNIRRIILRILSIRVEVDRPLKPSDGENIASNVFSNSHSLRERVPLDQEFVRTVNRLRYRARDRGG